MLEAAGQAGQDAHVFARKWFEVIGQRFLVVERRDPHTEAQTVIAQPKGGLAVAVIDLEDGRGSFDGLINQFRRELDIAPIDLNLAGFAEQFKDRL